MCRGLEHRVLGPGGGVWVTGAMGARGDVRAVWGGGGSDGGVNLYLDWNGGALAGWLVQQSDPPDCRAVRLMTSMSRQCGRYRMG